VKHYALMINEMRLGLHSVDLGYGGREMAIPESSRAQSAVLGSPRGDRPWRSAAQKQRKVMLTPGSTDPGSRDCGRAGQITAPKAAAPAIDQLRADRMLPLIHL
jgi:hypothetical protein